MVKAPVVLIILDGWGIAPEGPGNAVTLAKTPNFDRFWAAYPHSQLVASGEGVGLPRGEDGNSETGHLNLGAGRIVFQDLPRIGLSIADESFFKIPSFQAAAEHARRNHSSLHLLGLVGAGGVHSSLEHLFALIQIAKKLALQSVYLHLFTDGRDSAPNSAMVYLEKIEDEMKKAKVGKIATICGRYFAMDRDYHWDRTQKAYDLIVSGKGGQADSAAAAVQQAYKQGKSDEFIEPVLIDPQGLVKDNDAVIFFNFRIDRPRQLTKAFILPNFETMEVTAAAFDPYAEKYGLKLYELPKRMTTTFKREKILKNLFFVTMTEYEKGLPAQIAFSPETIEIPLARVLSEKGVRQFHIAETEKERFVTYYFNGQREDPFSGEDRIEIPSPNVPTYDQKPAMSAEIVTEELIKRIRANMYDFVVVNYANPDMVGHTGVLDAGVKACEITDQCLGRLVKTIINLKGTAVITADHGNIEEMIDLKTGQVDTKHSVNSVPFIIVSPKFETGRNNLPRGILADVAPTILAIMNIEKPVLMTGRSLIST